MTKWSEEAWAAARPIYESILNLPFVRELGEGTLDKERFLFYLAQDSKYLHEYTRVLAHIASRIAEPEYVSAFLAFAADGVMVEQAMHQQFLKGVDHEAIEMSPTCMLYTKFLLSQVYNPVEVEAAAVLPCFWIYQRVGESICRNSSGSDNPYKEWIDTYSDPTFAESTRKAVAICDSLAENAGEGVKRRMTEAFVTAAKMEWLFWESAYNLEKWKI